MANIKNPFPKLLKQIPAPFKNRYFVVLIIFMAWMIFFDRHDILTQYKLQQTLTRLEVDKEYYQEKIEQAKADRRDIIQNKEKFAREHYHMQKSDEDVFIFVDE